MKMYEEISLADFEAWSGAIETRERIIDEGKADEFDAMIEELYPEGLDATTLNDILWFESDWIFDRLGIEDEEEEDEEEEDEEEEDEEEEDEEEENEEYTNRILAELGLADKKPENEEDK